MTVSKPTSSDSTSDTRISSPSKTASSESTRNPWDRQPKEKSKDYQWFEPYLNLGPRRAVDRAYVLFCEQTGKPVPESRRAPPRYWEISRQNKWLERATAYDDYLAEQRRLEQEEIREIQRQGRKTIVQTTMDKLAKALDAANLDELDTDMARRLLPDIANALFKAIAAHRMELGEETAITKVENTGTVTIKTDDMVKARDELVVEGFEIVQPITA